MPAHLKTKVGWKLISTMRLRHGDFIEDRFGQAQKKMMTCPAIRTCPEDAKGLHKWFGSYLIWDPQPYAQELIGGQARVLVGHLRGRSRAFTPLATAGGGVDLLEGGERLCAELPQEHAASAGAGAAHGSRLAQESEDGGHGAHGGGGEGADRNGAGRRQGGGGGGCVAAANCGSGLCSQMQGLMVRDEEGLMVRDEEDEWLVSIVEVGS